MNEIKNKLFKFFRKVRGAFPSRLPQGGTEFNAWAEDIINTYEMPTVDLDSIKFVLASTILRLNETGAYRSKLYFALVLQTAAAKQVASGAFTEIKEKQQKALVDAAAAKAVADGPQK